MLRFASSVSAAAALFAIASLASAAPARADQCAIVPADQASAAATLLRGATIQLYCGACGEPRPTVASTVVARNASVHDGRTSLDGKDVDLAYVYIKTGPRTFTNVGLMVGCGATGVEPFLSFGAADDVAALQAELDGLNKRIDTAVDQVASAQTNADRQAAVARLDVLRKLKADLEPRLAAARAAALHKQRERGIHTSQQCLDNPLAPGC